MCVSSVLRFTGGSRATLVGATWMKCSFKSICHCCVHSLLWVKPPVDGFCTLLNSAPCSPINPSTQPRNRAVWETQKPWETMSCKKTQSRGIEVEYTRCKYLPKIIIYPRSHFSKSWKATKNFLVIPSAKSAHSNATVTASGFCEHDSLQMCHKC